MYQSTHAVPPFYKNAYVLGCERTREAVVIDPGDEIDELIHTVGAEHLVVTHILLTHAHLDHISGVAQAKAAFGAPVTLHEADLPLYRAVVQQGRMFGIDVQPQPPVDAFYQTRGIITFGDYEVRAHHTPGHCAGGVCLEVRKAGERRAALFVGDTLFAGSIGRTDLPGGDHDALLRSIRTVLFAFPDDTRVYPGHGTPTTIGHERENNPFLQ